MQSPADASLFSRTPRWVLICGGALLAILLLIAFWDWNWFKGTIERRVAETTGRAFEIRGDLDVDVGLTPRITAEDIHFANAEWSTKSDEMISVRKLDLRLALWPLMSGRVELPYLALDRPRILLERNAEERGNWIFEPKEPKKKGAGLPEVKQLLVKEGELRLHEVKFETDLRLDVKSGRPTADNPRAPLEWNGEGSWRGYPFQIDGRIDSPLDLQKQERPYRVDVRARAGHTRAHGSGALRGQLQPEDFDIQFDLAGNNLGDLYRQTGIALPDSAPYQLKGRLNRKGTVWSYRGFEGKVGSSDLAGDASIDLGSTPRAMKATLVSKHLAVRDLSGFINVPPGADDEDIAKAKAARAAKPTILPDKPFRLDKLRSLNADVRLVAKEIETKKLPLESMNAHLMLQDGVFEIKPLDFDAAGGSIASKLRLDARKATIQTSLITDVRNLELPKLFPTVQITKSGAGRLSGVMAVTAEGNSVADMFASANGDIGLIMGEGRISNLLVELAGLDVAESVKYLFDKERTIPLRCAYANLKIVDGRVTTRGLAFDTTDTVIFGEGTIDLHREAINMRLVPQPKDKSPLSVRVPLKIGGTFKDPSFRPEAGPLLMRTAAAAALYTVAPPAALLALIETGPGKNIDCGPAGGS